MNEGITVYLYSYRYVSLRSEEIILKRGVIKDIYQCSYVDLWYVDRW